MSPKDRTAWIERAQWALVCAFVFSIPWEKSLWVAGVGTVSRFLGIVAFAAAVLAALRRKSVRFPNLALVLAAAFVLWATLTCSWSLAREASIVRAFTFAQLLAMAWVIWDSCRDSRQQVQLMAAYVWGSLLPAADTLLHYARNEQTYYRRYAASGFDPNDLGLTLALSLPLCLYLALRGRGPLRWAYHSAAVLAIAAILLTASRATLIAAAMAFGFVLLTWRRSDRPQRVAGVILFALLLLGAFGLAPSASRQRLATIASELSQGTLHSRTTIWKAGVVAFKRRPLGGVGSGAYAAAVRPQLGGEHVAHNAFLSVLVECGIIGFGVFAALLGTLLVFVWMMPFTERMLWWVMLGVWSAGVSTLTWEHRKVTWLLFALIMTQWALAFRRAEAEA